MQGKCELQLLTDLASQLACGRITFLGRYDADPFHVPKLKVRVRSVVGAVVINVAESVHREQMKERVLTLWLLVLWQLQQ